MQLIDGNDYNFRDGLGRLHHQRRMDLHQRPPYSWTLAGDARTFAVMQTPAGLLRSRPMPTASVPWKPRWCWPIPSFPGASDGAGLKDVNAPSTPA